MNKFETFVQLLCWCCFFLHFALISYEFFDKEITTTNIYTEKLTLKNFPIIIRICIDPAFDDINYGYHNPQEFIGRQDINGMYWLLGHILKCIYLKRLFVYKVSMYQD